MITHATQILHDDQNIRKMINNGYCWQPMSDKFASSLWKGGAVMGWEL